MTGGVGPRHPGGGNTQHATVFAGRCRNTHRSTARSSHTVRPRSLRCRLLIYRPRPPASPCVGSTHSTGVCAHDAHSLTTRCGQRRPQSEISASSMATSVAHPEAELKRLGFLVGVAEASYSYLSTKTQPYATRAINLYSTCKESSSTLKVSTLMTPLYRTHRTHRSPKACTSVEPPSNLGYIDEAGQPGSLARVLSGATAAAHCVHRVCHSALRRGGAGEVQGGCAQAASGVRAAPPCISAVLYAPCFC